MQEDWGNNRSVVLFNVLRLDACLLMHLPMKWFSELNDNRVIEHTFHVTKVPFNCQMTISRDLLHDSEINLNLKIQMMEWDCLLYTSPSPRD